MTEKCKHNIFYDRRFNYITKRKKKSNIGNTGPYIRVIEY